jgi:hypothetical protein
MKILNAEGQKQLYFISIVNNLGIHMRPIVSSIGSPRYALAGPLYKSLDTH